MKKIVFVLLLSCGLIASAQQASKKNRVSDKVVTEWFEKGTWKDGFKAQPAPSVDKHLVYEHYMKFPDRWKKVFEFLNTNDLLKIPLGKKNLDDNIIVNVQEYTTRDPGEQRLEGHRKYIDFQYVITGRELMGCGNILNAKEVVTFDPSKDYGGYTLPIFPYYVATSDYFFIFFPSQVHLTNLQVGEKAPVRKIVFKIKVD
jgi:YhcH/YjgK/YiaL family protein